MQRTHRWLLVAVVAFGVGCGGGDSTGPNDSVAGVYSLRTVNGANLPFVLIQVGADKVEITADVLTLTDAGSFTEITTIRTTTNGQVSTTTEADAGSYTRSGTAITATYNSGGTATGTIGGGTITVAFEGLSLVYRK